MQCNICGCKTFMDMRTRKNVVCTKCNSFERTRLMWLYLEQQNITEESKVLHIAPDKGIYSALSRRIASQNYHVVDFSPEQYPFAKKCQKIDLCDLDDYPSFQYDYIIHMHVLEHIPCNIAYTLYHLHRMLKKNGRHICIIPFMGGKYDECFQDISAEERQRRFGQFDHVRCFGNQDIDQHLGKLLNMPKVFDPVAQYSEHVLREANIPPSHWKGFHIGTVLVLERNDMKLLSDK